MPERPITDAMWRVTCVNSQTRQVFQRDLYVELATIPSDDRAEMQSILADSISGRWGMLKYRRYFKEQKPRYDLNERWHASFCIPRYYEDEAGNPLDELRFMQVYTGHEDIIIAGNPNSVLRLGPSSMARPEKWSAKKANDIAHFLEVVHCLALSDWIEAPISFSFIIFIRQLMSDGDKLFKLATDAYLCHTADEGKRAYVMQRRDCFNGVLGHEPFPLQKSGITGRQLIVLFFYGFGLIHRDDTKKQEFREIITRLGREMVMLGIHTTLQHVVCHADNVARVIRQDFLHWVATNQCPPPDRIGIVDLLGEIE